MSKIDFVQFLPTSHSEVLAKKVNFQFERKLETQLRGIEREQKFKRCIIEKTNTTFQRHLTVKMRRQRSLTTTQGCFQFVEDSTSGEIFFNLNRQSTKSPKDGDRYQNIRYGGEEDDRCGVDSKKDKYVHRSLSRSQSDGQRQQQNLSTKKPTPIPKRLTQSFDGGGKKPLTRVRNATTIELGRRYDRWCTSLEEMESTGPKKELVENSPPTSVTTPYVNHTSRRHRNPSNCSDIQEIKLDMQEEKHLPKLPDKEKPALRRQRKVCRVRSLPNNSSSPAPELPDFIGSKLTKENSKVFPRMLNPAIKVGLKLPDKSIDLNNNNNTNMLSELTITDHPTAANGAGYESKLATIKKAWHEAEDVLPELVIKQEHYKDKLRSTKSLQ